MVNQRLRKPGKNTLGNRYHYRLSFSFKSLRRVGRVIASCATNTFIRVPSLDSGGGRAPIHRPRPPTHPTGDLRALILSLVA